MSTTDIAKNHANIVQIDSQTTLPSRIAYYHAIAQFLDWCQRAGFCGLEDIEPITVAAYVEQHPGSPATIKQHMSAIRMLFSWLTEKGILAMNPAREVKTEKFSRAEGKTPAFDTDQVQKVLDKIDTSNEVGLRDRALLGTLAYTFARIGAVVNLKVEDYFQTGKRSMIRFSEKGGKETEIPMHHKLEELLDQYLETSGLRNRPNATLFPIALGKTRKLGNRPATESMQPECSNAGSKTLDCRMHSLPIPLGQQGSRIFWRMEEH
jgi:integrase/recombinase XerD